MASSTESKESTFSCSLSLISIAIRPPGRIGTSIVKANKPLDRRRQLAFARSTPLTGSVGQQVEIPAEYLSAPSGR